jgi:hypothetical protein
MPLVAKVSTWSMPSYVAVSESPRTLETAIAMGLAVDDVVGIESATVSGEVEFDEWWDWPNPWAVYLDLIEARHTMAECAAVQATAA